MSSTAAVRPAPQAMRIPAPSNRTIALCSWLFAIALFGYPIIGNIISLLQIDSRTLSVPFRVGVCLFSAFVFMQRRRLKIDGLRQVMIVIWFLYILRLLHDWLLPNIEGADYALQFFLASSVFPAIALMKANAYQSRPYALIGFFVASVGALTTMLAAFFGSNDVQEVAATTGRLSLAAIDPVSLGNQAASAVLCAVVLWRGSRFGFRFIVATTVVLLLWCLLLTGSKGPALALVLCIGLWAVRRGYAWRFALIAMPMMIWMVSSNENILAARLAASTDDQSTVDRVVIFNDSLSQIANSPLIGSAFVELNSGYYPHDIFVEAGLAFGVPVALVFCGLIFVGTYKAWKTLNSDYDLLGLIFFQGLFAAVVSSSIYGSILLWVTFAMLPTATKPARGPRQMASADLILPTSR